jgi:cellulose synthase (UDP-forming)
MAAWERHYRLREMAADLGIGYFTRETNQQAKAGNINHALQYTDGEVLLILDCDHVPTKDILQNTVGHFIADPKLFLVQTPHFFINPTPVEKNLEGMATPSGESDMFYRRIHPALDFWNASYFCGSAALLRRKFLMEVGGICGTTITEDAETAFQLHARGYNSRYVNIPMVCGLSPESYDDYVIQRSRWAQGMVQLVLLNNPLKTKGLSVPQKMAYFNSSFFWLFGFPRFIYFIAPAMYLILGWNIYHASWMQIVAFTLPYVLSIYLIMDFFYAGTRQAFFSEIYESVQSLFLIPAVLSVLINPWKPSFKVTPKGLTNEKNYLSPLAAPFFLVIGINVTASILAGVKWFTEPLLREVIVVTVIWCFYNLYLSVVSLGAFWERRQIRKFYRIGASGPVSAHFPRMDATYPGEVRDVSLTGIGFEIQLPFVPREQDQVTLEVKDSYGRSYRFENRIHRGTIRNGKYFCGSEFITTRVSYADVVSYVFGDSQRWQDNWDQKSASRGTYLMLWYFMKTGVLGFVGGVVPLLIHTLGQLWKLGIKLTTTHVLRDKVLAVTSWCVYFFYLSLATLVQMLDKKQVRKLQRMGASGAATIYFPRLDATLLGKVTDVSLTGIGVSAELPFKIREREHATIKTTGKDGEKHQFACVIQRTIKRDEKIIFGAEFIVDMYSYPRIVRFVYGSSLRMLDYVLIQGSSLLIQGEAATMNILARAGKVAVRVLAFIFLNPETQVKKKQA